MSKHSRGPWYWNINAADYLELRTAEEGNPTIGQWGDWPALSSADADLIAAAPDMLALLQRIRDEQWLDGTRAGDDVRSLIKNVLSKHDDGES